MRQACAATILAIAVIAAPAAARAGWLIEGSLGTGFQTKPDVERIPTNVMIAPGFTLLGLLALQLGIVGDLGDVENSEFDLQLRPMVKIDPPMLPLYGRLIFAFADLLADDRETQFAWGGALGLGLSLGGLGVFAEAGVLPRTVDAADGTSEINTILEGRVGVSLGF